MESVIGKLAEIEETAEAIVRHAHEQKAEIASELQEARDEFDRVTEEETRQRISEIREGYEKRMSALIAEQKEKNHSVIEELKKDYEEHHAAYAGEILKNILEV